MENAEGCSPAEPEVVGSPGAPSRSLNRSSDRLSRGSNHADQPRDDLSVLVHSRTRSIAPRTDRMSAFRPSVARTARTGPSAQQVLHWRRRYHKRPSGRNCRSGCPRTLGRRPHPFGSSAIGTLVERSSRFTMLLHLPRMHGYQQSLRIKNGPPLAGHGAEAVRRAIARSMGKLPEQLRQSLTWDHGAEMAQQPTCASTPGSRFTSAIPKPVAARLQRKHQRLAETVLSKGHGSQSAHSPGTGRSRPCYQHKTAQNARL